ncbi:MULTISPECIES: CHAP domain-containing protein [Thermomonospora]|uniref:Peptidase C51 domain-containing protein n=1 Tax=Thermomonospora cellulosilytica TaxID=1411118 RepID=A0A7W3RB76_9ACTN|nr:MULTISPECIES: CHAP domain-containing protein [Thermomonospora]MBA9006677.1 hypothetical protein [Thermomonospora cellulosilytica]
MAGKRRFDRLTRITDTVNTIPGLTRLAEGFRSRQGAVAGALVAGAVATTGLTIATQAPAESAVRAASPVNVFADEGDRSEGRGEGEVTAEKKATAEDVIKIAKSQVGIGEDSAGKSKYGEWFATTDRAVQTVKRDGGSNPKVYEDAAWCAMFLAWVADKTGDKDVLGADPYTVTYAGSFEDQGRWGTKAKPGAIVFFDWDGGKSIGGIDHVGLVTEVLDNGKVKTVEGNISNQVVSKVRTPDTIVGYGYPEYAG